jgi:hypothetical protein
MVVWERFGDDIKKFGRVLKVIHALEPVFAFISVRAMLMMFRFSKVRHLRSFYANLSHDDLLVVVGLWGHHCISARCLVFWHRQSNAVCFLRDSRACFHGSQHAPSPFDSTTPFSVLHDSDR